MNQEELSTAIERRIVPHGPDGECSNPDLCSDLTDLRVAIEREARDGSHPRTYSLVGGGLDMFLVTDDESGINLGYARKVGGPITKPMVRA